jgi:rhodanese-related sulfurtransferase
MSFAREILLLLGLTCVAAAATKLFHPRAPAFYQNAEPLAADEVTMTVIAQKWKGDVLWIDARPREQFEKKHVPGALLINEQERDALLADAIITLQDNKKPVVVYCDSSGCQASRKVRDYLAQNFPTMDFYVLRGGWKAFREAR